MKRALAIGALVFALTGCGTVKNFQRESLTDATPYGGVEIATEWFKPGLKNCGFPSVVGLPFYAGDMVFSAIADTLTLPVTVPLAITKSINDYYFPPDKPADANKWREFWYNDAPPPPRVSGGIY